MDILVFLFWYIWLKFAGLCDLDAIKVEQHNELKTKSAQSVLQTSVSNESFEKTKPPEEAIPMKKARTFTYIQLVNATDNFKSAYFLGEGGFGKVYKGKLEDSDQVS